MSHPPLLGPLKLMVDGVLSMVKAGFDLLPHSNYSNTYVHADDDTQRFSALVRDQRYVRSGKIINGGLAKVAPSLRRPGANSKSISYDLAVVCPPVEFGPTVCGDLLRRKLPFVCLVPFPCWPAGVGAGAGMGRRTLVSGDQRSFGW